MKFHRKLISLLTVATLTLGISACGSNVDSQNPSPSVPTSVTPSKSAELPADKELYGKIVIEGSTSVQKIFQELADTFMEKNNSVTVEYMGTGSSSGMKAAISGTADIGTASRAVKDEEKSGGLEVVQVATDAIAVIVNAGNKVTDLTQSQIAQIYKKEITNWKEVGGDDLAIVVVARDAASGTREAFETIFDVKEQVKADQEAAKTGEVKMVVSQNPNAIGYISLAYSDDTVKNIVIDGMIATTDNVKAGSYTVTRPFNAVTLGAPSELEQAFIDFIFTEEGAAIISKEAVPVSK